ncbi:hypothetical protein PISMIDRAFT_682919, partial [Pisolithus microcarpus 441]
MQARQRRVSLRAYYVAHGKAAYTCLRQERHPRRCSYRAVPTRLSSSSDPRMTEFGYSPAHVLVHGSYLMNLGNPDKRVFSFLSLPHQIEEESSLLVAHVGRTSVVRNGTEYECFLDGIQQCERLGLELYNLQQV